MKKDLVVPRMGVNDDYVTICEWCVKSGEWVESNQTIAVLETTKETKDFSIEEEGYVFYDIEEGAEVKVGNAFAILSSTKEMPVVFDEKNEDINISITQKAQNLIDEYGIDISLLPKDKIIKEKDIMKIIEKKKSKRDVMPEWVNNGLVIMAGGGLAKMCIDSLRQLCQYEIRGILDPNLKEGSTFMGIPVLGGDELLKEKYTEGLRYAVNAVGSIDIDAKSKNYCLRKEIYKKLKDNNYLLPNIFHPKAIVEPSVKMGEGNLVFAGAIIESNAFIENNCIINTGAIISHDCIIHSHSRISPGAILAGNVEVGENTLIGMGVTVYLGCKIGNNVIISNGKNVFQNIPDNTVVR